MVVIPILKPGMNPAIAIAESYRPISFTSDLCKVLERIIYKKLVHIIEERNLLPSQQYGFRKNHYTAMISLDISKAYDMYWPYNILKKVKTWKIDGKML
jgi:hypothetical protein